MTVSSAGPAPHSRPRAVIAWTVLGLLLLTSCGLGNIAAYLVLIATLLVLVTLPRPGEWRAAVLMPANLAFLAAFAALALGSVVNAFTGDRISTIVLFIPLLLGIPAAIAFKASASSNGVVRLGQLALAGSALSLVVVVMEGMVFGAYRPSGLEFSPIHYATIAQMLGFLALCVPFQQKRWRDALYLAGPVLGLAAALLTGTRAGLITFVLLTLAASVFAIYRFRPKLWMIAAALAVLAAIAALAAFTFRDGDIARALSTVDAMVRAMQGDLASDTSTAYRLEMYSSALRAVLDAPLFGHGWHNQVLAALPYMSEFGRQGYAAEGWNYIHNDALSFLVSGGIFGLAAYGLIFAAPVLAIVHSPRDSQFFSRAYALATIALAIFAAGITDVVFMVELPKVMLAIFSVGLPLMCVDRPAGLKEQDRSAP